MPASVIGTTVFGFMFWFGAPLVLRMLGREPAARSRWWLAAAIGAVAISWYLPSPILEQHTATFSQHAVGGGLASTLVAYYFLTQVGPTRWFQRGLVILTVTSILGVGNELLELALDVVRGTRLTADAAWDLFANTTGAALSFLAFEAARAVVGRALASDPVS